jgi:hypothetical protein
MQKRRKVGGYNLSGRTTGKQVDARCLIGNDNEVAADIAALPIASAKRWSMENARQRPAKETSQVVSCADMLACPVQSGYSRLAMRGTENHKSIAVLFVVKVSLYDCGKPRLDHLTIARIDSHMVIGRRGTQADQNAPKAFGMVKEQNVARQRTETSQFLSDRDTPAFGSG